MATVPRGTLTPLTEAEIEQADADDRHAEAWYLCNTGWSQRKVAERFGVTPTTIRNWLDRYAKERRTRAEDVEYETERLIGQMEAVASKAWESHGRLPDNSMAGPSYLKTVIEAVQVIARLRGIDGLKKEASGTRSTTVVVRFGGGVPSRRDDVIDVGVLEEETAA
jgi:transposase-like protein